MGVNSFGELREHVGHEIECGCYGDKLVNNVAIECITCGAVLVDYENPECKPNPDSKLTIKEEQELAALEQTAKERFIEVSDWGLVIEMLDEKQKERYHELFDKEMN